MADTGLPAPPVSPTPQAFQLKLPQQPAQWPVSPNQPIPTHPIQHMPQLN